MKITLNNNSEELSGDVMTVQQLLNIKKFTFKMLVIKINGSLIKKEDYDKAVIADGDNVDVIHLISGG
jgi:thiamine biosynthesis protein ThiS